METSDISLLFWHFENAMSARDVSIAVGISSMPEVVNGFASQTGGGPIEHWGEQGPIFLTRWLGTNDMFLWVSVTRPVFLSALTFKHWHNHNPGYPTHPSYAVQLQLDEDDGYRNVGRPLLLSDANSGTTDTLVIGKSVPVGNYKIRWRPKDLNRGRDTSTEFFAVKDLVLTGHLVDDAPRRARRSREIDPDTSP